MDRFNNLKLTSHLPISKAFIDLGIDSFKVACEYVQNLPYRRTSNRSDFALVLSEQCGTCSSKHGLLKALAIENNFNDIKLCIGIYKMNALNTKGIGTVLESYNLDYIPEAHTYLKVNIDRIDITGLSTSEVNFSDALMSEVCILPDQIGDYKVVLHQDFIKHWIAETNCPYDFETIWSIREQCIANLSA